jgi:hypothetical protein
MNTLKKIIKSLLRGLFLLFILGLGDLTANFLRCIMLDGVSANVGVDPGLTAILFIIFVFIVLAINPKLRKYKNFSKFLGILYMSYAIGFLTGTIKGIVLYNIDLISIIVNLGIIGILGVEAWSFLDKYFDEEN